MSESPVRADESVNRRIDALIDRGRVPSGARATHGYLDVLDELPPATTIGARAMRTWFYPVFYERLRPTAFRIASGFAAPGREGDRATLARRLDLRAGQTVLDIGCGPGNFTAFLGAAVGGDGGDGGDGGLAVGLDASDPMLATAAATNPGRSVGYLRGDAENLPFHDASFDAVACLAALYLMNDPFAAIEEAARVLRPGGRLAVLTSYRGAHPPGLAYGAAVRVTSGIRVFGGGEITTAFRRAGLVDVEQRVQGLSQSVWARKPADPTSG